MTVQTDSTTWWDELPPYSAYSSLIQRCRAALQAALFLLLAGAALSMSGIFILAVTGWGQPTDMIPMQGSLDLLPWYVLGLSLIICGFVIRCSVQTSVPAQRSFDELTHVRRTLRPRTKLQVVEPARNDLVTPRRTLSIVVK